MRDPARGVLPAARSLVLLGFLVTLFWWPAGTAGGQELRSTIDRDVRPAHVREELPEVDSKLRAGKWKAGLRHAQRLTETVVRRTWYGRELRPVLSELALYQALAEANLDRREQAIWHWHIAQNLDPAMRRRDLAPYGKAGKLLYEHLLRALGEVPVPFVVPETYPGGPRLVGAVQPEMKSEPTVLNNTGAAIEGTGSFHVEVLIDEQGRIHQPVVTSTHLHPIVIYASLEWLRRLPRFEPSRFEGEPADSLDRVTIRFKVSRW